MKKKLKSIACAAITLSLTGAMLAATGCSSPSAYVTSILPAQTDDGTAYTVTYSDGRTDTITVANGRDGKDGQNGKDGLTSIDDVYAKYVAEYGEISYADFLTNYLTATTDSTAVVGECLQSSLKVYSTFVTSSAPIYWGFGSGQKTYSYGYAQGSAVLYKIDGDDAYVVTNYHVVYNSKADETANGGKLAKEIYCYLYGSEGAPVQTTEKDSVYGYSLYDFGQYAIPCEYVGGSLTADLAVLKAKKSDIYAINEDAREVRLADGYTVGESATAIGNTEGEGISVTKGIVSVDNEYIALNIDGTGRYYRCLRIDTSIYSGNSGGGLFNAEGKLIGITNAGSTEDQNINYAIPIEIVKGTVDNILHYANDGDDETAGAYKIALGITVQSQNSKYVYDAKKGCGKITEDVAISAIEENSIALSMGLQTGDVIKEISVNGTAHAVERNFDISDILLLVRENDRISVKYVRDSETKTSTAYTVLTSDLTKVL